jgi:hypothetical protein
MIERAALMGIVVQREFTVDRDDRREFERESRLGVWEGMRLLGSQMIAYGGWSLGGPGDVAVTNSAYADFDHWTATRAWGEFNSDPAMLAEREQVNAISAGRTRLVLSSRAHVIEYDDELSEPNPFHRAAGGPLSDLAPTFGLQSVVSETGFDIAAGERDEFIAISQDAIWPWYREQGARLMIVGRDPLRAVDQAVVMVAFPSIGHWHRTQGAAAANAPSEVAGALQRRALLTANQQARLLMVQTAFGKPVAG